MSCLRPRGGLTRLDVVALILVGFFATFFGTIALSKQQETNRATECAARLAELGKALITRSYREGVFPGYLNVLQRDDGKPYVDPETQQPAPVSWAVMILPDINQRTLYDEWRKNAPGAIDPRKAVVGQLLCPGEFDVAPTEPFTSYVVNTGMPDAPQSTPFKVGPAPIPRDWGANGMFFDNFTDHQLIVSNTNRAPMVYMNDEKVPDPKDKTIFLTENVDATEYVIRGATHAAENWKAVEVQMGCTWQVGKIDPTTSPPTMKPPVASLQPNVDAGKGDGKKFDYCRPSSRHPGSFNVCMVAGNVQMLNEKISYLVLAKLMASDDDRVKEVGSTKLADATLREWQLAEADLSP